jgi:hypothetical protein
MPTAFRGKQHFAVENESIRIAAAIHRAAAKGNAENNSRTSISVRSGAGIA